jgi:hypothetical protein
MVAFWWWWTLNIRSRFFENGTQRRCVWSDSSGSYNFGESGCHGMPGEFRVGEDRFLKCTIVSSIWLDIVSI